MTATLLSLTILVYADIVPSERRVVLDVFKCYYEMNYDYTAHLKPNSLYGEKVGKGVILYTKLTKEIEALGLYNMTCNKPCKLQVNPTVTHYLEGVAEKTGWKKQVNGLVEEKVTVSENGQNAVVELFYDLTEINQLIQEIENDTGVMMPQYTLTSVIEYNINGEIGNSSFSDTKTQMIALSITYGTGYTWERAGVIEITAKNDKGVLVEIPVIKVVKNEAVVMLQMILPLITLGAGTTGTIMAIIVRDIEEQKKPEWQRLKSKLKAIDAKRLPTLEIVPLKSPNDLARIAKDYDSKIFHVQNEDQHTFFTSDGNLLYAYSCPDRQ